MEAGHSLWVVAHKEMSPLLVVDVGTHVEPEAHAEPKLQHSPPYSEGHRNALVPVQARAQHVVEVVGVPLIVTKAVPH